MVHTEGTVLPYKKTTSAVSAKSNTGNQFSIHDYIDKQLDIVKAMGTSQSDVAKACGYTRPTMINMMRSGLVRVPLDKVPSLAKALHADPAFMFRLAMQQYPVAAEAVAEIFGTVLTANERRIIDKIREVSKNTDPVLTREAEQKLKSAFGK